MDRDLLARLDERVRTLESWRADSEREQERRREYMHERISLVIQAAVSGAFGWAVGHFSVYFHK